MGALRPFWSARTIRLAVPVRAVDISNYTNQGLGPLTVDQVLAWKADGVQLVIIQAFPPSYAAKYAEQLDQTRTCIAAGMPFGDYIYDYLADPSWRDGALTGIAQAIASGLPRPVLVAADEEDTSARNLPLAKRISAVKATVVAIRNAGYFVVLYTGRWFWAARVYLNNATDLSAMGIPLWDANYDGVDDPALGFVPYGGWTRCLLKQYWGTSTLDGVTNVDLDAEAA